MYLFSVAPIASGLPLSELSYFSKEELSSGTLVFITIKKRKIPGIVTTIQKVEDERMAIKQSSFAIKKITSKEKQDFIESDLMNAIINFSSYSLIKIPSLLAAILPEKLISERSTIKLFSNKKEKRQEIYVISLPKKERIIRYKSSIRESFAKNESIVIYFPTITELIEMKEKLSKGIEDYTLVLHSKQTQKELAQSEEFFEKKHPLLILSTPSLTSFRRKDIGIIIIEDEINHHYRNQNSIDFRVFFETICTQLHIQLLFGSTLLSLERYHAYKTGKAIELSTLYIRNNNLCDIVPMNESGKESSPYLSLQTLHELEKMYEEKNGHYFIYTQRKGMYPSTVCSDCSTLLTCKTCEKPLVLHSIGSGKAYICHYCENLTRITEDNPVHCSTCGGWRMKLLGIASSGIEQLLSKSNIPLFVIDGERTKTKKEIDSVIKSWKNEPFSILIGTELALNVLQECDATTVASLDSLFSLPEYGIDERILAILTSLKEKTKGKVILQTRMNKNPFFKHLTDYSFLNYYESSLEERKQSHLPPFYTIIKCSYDILSVKEKEYLSDELKALNKEHVWFESGPQKILLFISIEETEWREKTELRKKITTLCSSGKIEHNPKNFFS